MNKILLNHEASIRRVVPRWLLRKARPGWHYLNRKRAGSLSTIEGILHSLATVSLADYQEQFAQGKNELSRIPLDIGEIEINDSCNLDCAMCRTSLSTRKKGLMDQGLFEQAVIKLRNSGVKTTNLHTIGDPLANKNLGRYLAILRKHGMEVPALSSNSLMIDRHIDTLFEYRDVIKAFRPSIDAASKETYEKIRIGGDFDELHRNLRLFASYNDKAANPFPVYVSNVVSKDNFSEIARIPYEFNYVAKLENFGFAFVSSLSPQNEYFLTKSYFGNAFSQRSPCSMIWDSIYVLKDGGLTACCRDYNGDLVFGNIQTDTLEESYNSDKIRGIRRAHLDQRVEDMPELCQSCYVVDSRMNDIINEIFAYYFKSANRGPDILQDVIDRTGQALLCGDYDEILRIVKNL